MDVRLSSSWSAALLSIWTPVELASLRGTRGRNHSWIPLAGWKIRVREQPIRTVGGVAEFVRSRLQAQFTIDRLTTLLVLERLRKVQRSQRLVNASARLFSGNWPGNLAYCVMNDFAAGLFGFERRSRDIATAF